MNIHEAIKACLETGKSFKNDYLSIEMNMGDLHLRNKKGYIGLRNDAREGFEEIFAPSSWDDLCVLAKHKEFSASRKLADGSIVKLYFSKKGITLNEEFGDIYFPTKEDVYANDWNREVVSRSEPKYKVGECLVLKDGGSPVFISKIQKQKVSETLSECWFYTLLDEKGNTFDNIVDLQLDCVYVKSDPPKYRVGEKFQTTNEFRDAKAVWTIVRTYKDPTKFGERGWLYYLEIEGSKNEYEPLSEKNMQREFSKIEIPIEKPEPKYKVDEEIACKGFQYTISKAVFCSEQKEWIYSLRSPSICAVNKEDVLERYIERLPEPKYKIGDTFNSKDGGYIHGGILWTIISVDNKLDSYIIENEEKKIWKISEAELIKDFKKVKLEPELKPKYSAGTCFKSKAGAIWTLIHAEVRNRLNPDKRYIEYQIEYKNTVDWISESDLEANYVHVPLPEEERQKYDLTWDQMISKLQEKQIAEFRNNHAGPNRNIFQRTCITKKDGQLILLEGSKPYIPDLEATSSKWKLYDLPKKEPKYKIGDKLKECFRGGIPKSSCFQIVDYRSGFEYDKIVWYYKIASWDEKDVSTQESLKGTSTYWVCEFSLDAHWVKGLSITKKPKAKFKKDDIVTLVNYRENFKIKTVRWDSFLNMWGYTIVNTSGEKTYYLESFLALLPERPLEKKSFRNPLSNRPVSQGIQRGFNIDS